MQPLPLKRRLHIRLAKSAAILAVLLGIVISGSQIGADLFQMRHHVARDISQVLASVSDSAAAAAYELDQQYADQIVQGVLHYRAINHALIVDDLGNLLAEARRPHLPQNTTWLTHKLAGDMTEFSQTLVDPDQQTLIGEMRVSLDPNVVTADFLERALLMVLSGLARSLLYAGILLALFYFMLTRPLMRAVHEIHNAPEDTPEQPFPKTKLTQRQDELGLLVQSFLRLWRRQWQANERLRALLENSPAMISIHDRQGAPIMVNRRYQELLPDAATNPTIHAELSGLHQQVLSYGQVVTAELHWQVGDREQIHMLAAFPLFGSEGEVDGVASLFTDITSRIEAERQRELLQEQLVISQKMEAVGVLASGIAHDFNNMLHVISGYTQLAKSNHSNPELREKQLTHVSTAADHAAALVRDLLTFSRSSASDHSKIDLNEEIQAALRLIEHTMPRMIEIEINLVEAPLPILANAHQIEQVLINLCNNARDAMPDGGRLSIVSETAHNDAGEPLAVVHISDSGTGMDTATLERIFDPFFTTKPVGKGTGLGLSTLYGIVTGVGGSVNCESELGQGSRFSLQFPLLTILDTDQTHEPAMSQSSANADAIRVLVVDDEQPIRVLLKTLLSSIGYVVDCVESGEAALVRIDQQRPPYEMMIIDLGMPGMGGMEAIRRLRQQKNPIRILVASGYGGKDQTQKVFEAGADGFIGKPFQLDEVHQEIGRILYLQKGKEE